MDNIPDWVSITARIALLGEIYPEIRGIALKNDEGKLLIRYYLDRHPTEYDYESIEMVYTNFDTALGYPNSIVSASLECVYSFEKQASLDKLDGFLYLRREY